MGLGPSGRLTSGGNRIGSNSTNPPERARPSQLGHHQRRPPHRVARPHRDARARGHPRPPRCRPRSRPTGTRPAWAAWSRRGPGSPEPRRGSGRPTRPPSAARRGHGTPVAWDRSRSWAVATEVVDGQADSVSRVDVTHGAILFQPPVTTKPAHSGEPVGCPVRRLRSPPMDDADAVLAANTSVLRGLRVRRPRRDVRRVAARRQRVVHAPRLVVAAGLGRRVGVVVRAVHQRPAVAVHRHRRAGARSGATWRG